VIIHHAPAARRSRRPRSAWFPLVLAAVSLATTAEALTFTGPSLVDSTGTFDPVSGGEIVVTDTALGFSIVGDVQTSTDGTNSISISRPFTIDLLPETIDTSASEDWKMVLAGGSCCPATGTTFSATTSLSIFPAGQTSGATQIVTSQSVFSPDNEIALIGATYFDVLGFRLPFALAPGDYVLDFTLAFTLTLGGPADFPEAGFIEFGGITGFDGFALTASGTSAPEPSTALLLGAGLAGLAARRRGLRGY